MTTTSTLGIIVGSVVLVVVARGYMTAAETSNQADLNAKLVAHQVELGRVAERAAAQTCRERLPDMLDEFKRLAEAGSYLEATTALGACPRLLADPKLQALATSVEVLQHKRTFADTHVSTYERLNAIDLIKKISPADAELLEPQRARLQAAADKLEADKERQAKARDTAERRRKGVTLGMTADDVYRSSWGRPTSVNRSTYTFGVHEQWVYPGGYLYFKDGILDSIQN